MKESWKVFSPEEKDFFFSKLKSSGFTYRPVWEGLGEKPVSRVAYVWDIFGHSGLSPFALAGITKHSPSEVLEQIKTEQANCTLSLCNETQLPILFFFSFYKEGGTGFNDYYNEEVSDHFTEYEDNEEDYREDYRDFPYEERTLEALLEKYGGANYRRFCNRRFDPFKVGKRNYIKPEIWTYLREVYLGRPLRKKLTVGGKEGAA